MVTWCCSDCFVPSELDFEATGGFVYVIICPIIESIESQ